MGSNHVKKYVISLISGDKRVVGKHPGSTICCAEIRALFWNTYLVEKKDWPIEYCAAGDEAFIGNEIHFLAKACLVAKGWLKLLPFELLLKYFLNNHG